ncbi:hypothetical protein EQ718_24135 (plasmid) [Paracoccus versutus]|uniref:hypothetical protein n=1 Tax=Paracoccus versutus TaxID=34007 RepID=UPI0011C051C6|nr:hypothetical protein [Paracoccus versutus]WEJ80962.1 hypothetical protein EQ718_18870 [Paracoccus versutus]WEJ81892.1 hypothetical protein EQ718_24135 [Paracoccus versutus]
MSEKDLWQEVLLLAIQDALHGVPGGFGNRDTRLRMTEDARNYLTTPSADLAEVCALVGLDMHSVIERMRKQIANAPTIDQLFSVRKKPSRPGKTLTHQGETLTINEWAERLNLQPHTICARLKNGLSVEEALSPDKLPTGQKSRQPRWITHNGETRTVRDWSQRLGLKPVTIHYRLRKGATAAEALQPVA